MVLTQKQIVEEFGDTRFDWLAVPTKERLSKSTATVETFNDRLYQDGDGEAQVVTSKRVRMTGDVLTRLFRNGLLTERQHGAGKRYDTLSSLARGSQIKSSLGQFAASSGGGSRPRAVVEYLDILIELQRRLEPQERIALDMIIWQDLEPVLCGKTLDSKLRVWSTDKKWRALAMQHLRAGLDKL